jgi:hypothetical protein
MFGKQPMIQRTAARTEAKGESIGALVLIGNLWPLKGPDK